MNFKQKEFENKVEKIEQNKQQTILSLKHVYEQNKSKWIEETILQTLKNEI